MRMKRLLVLFICFVMVVSLSPVAAHADTEKEYTICNIPRTDGNEYYTIAGIRWRLIGRDDEKGVGLLFSGSVKLITCQWDDAPYYYEEFYRDCFSDLEKSFVIPTSKPREINYVEDQECYSSELNEAKLFLLSIGEARYYMDNDEDFADYPIPWWTRTGLAGSDSIFVSVSDCSLTSELSERIDPGSIRVACQVDLNALEGVQALPPALPEGVFSTKTGVYKITDKAKKEVQMIEGNVSAKGVLTVPKTVTYEKKRYKVTSIREMTFDGHSELKTVKITAGNLKAVGDNAFRFINKKAVFKIKGTVKAFRKLKKVIKESAGLPKTVKFKRIKN